MVQPAAPPPLRYQVPQVPFVRYESRQAPGGQLWLFFSCDRCGDRTQKPCGDMRRSSHWLQVYVRLHVHR